MLKKYLIASNKYIYCQLECRFMTLIMTPNMNRNYIPASKIYVRKIFTPVLTAYKHLRQKAVFEYNLSGILSLLTATYIV